jgi:vesicular inhibitory amino acid transporter
MFNAQYPTNESFDIYYNNIQETEIIPSEVYNIPLSFGLMMAGFAGHAVFPAIYSDMENPKQYENMVDLTYVITVAVYITMAIAGYAMFGLETMQEVLCNDTWKGI